MSLQRREFFEMLEEDQQYLSCLTTEEAYNEIPEYIRAQMVINEIRQDNPVFKNDPVHKELVNKKYKANKELRDYEYKINNSKK